MFCRLIIILNKYLCPTIYNDAQSGK